MYYDIPSSPAAQQLCPDHVLVDGLRIAFWVLSLCKKMKQFY